MSKKTEFDQKVADKVCDLLAEGKSIARICVRKGMPSKQVLLRWLKENPAFQAQYGLAKGLWAHGEASGIVELADSARGKPNEEVQAVRLMVDTRKWLFGKYLPKVYGEKLNIDADVKVTEEPSADNFARVMLFEMSREALKAPMESFIETQVLILKLVAENIAKRGGGSLDPRMHEGTFGELAKGLRNVAEVVRRRLSGESKGLLPAPAPTAQEPGEKNATPGDAPDAGPSTRAREDEEVI